VKEELVHLIEQPSCGVQHILQDAIVASLSSEHQSRPALLILVAQSQSYSQVSHGI
jgi:hypothetical protein